MQQWSFSDFRNPARTSVITSFLRQTMLINQSTDDDSQTCKQKMRMNCEELLRAAKWKVSPCKQRSLSMFMNRNFRTNPANPNFLCLKSETYLFVNNISDLHWSLEIEWQISTKVSLWKQGTHGATKLASIVDQCKIVQTFEFIIISWFMKIYRKRIQPLPWTAEIIIFEQPFPASHNLVVQI